MPLARKAKNERTNLMTKEQFSGGFSDHTPLLNPPSRNYSNRALLINVRGGSIARCPIWKREVRFGGQSPAS
jgi:hypothetical protein